MKKRSTFPIIILMCSILLCACNNNGKSMKTECVDKNGENEQEEYVESTGGEADTDRQIEKGYDLPIDARRREEAEEDCKEMMERICTFYQQKAHGAMMISL